MNVFPLHVRMEENVMILWTAMFVNVQQDTQEYSAKQVTHNFLYSQLLIVVVKYLKNYSLVAIISFYVVRNLCYPVLITDMINPFSH